MGFFRDNEVLRDVGAGEKLEKLMEFSRLHGVQFGFIPPFWFNLSYLNCFFVFRFFFFSGSSDTRIFLLHY
jgi:hypothetical protein